MNNNEAELLITRNILGRIGFNDGKKTFIMPISYAYHENKIYCHSKEGLKIVTMREKPEVCFQIDEITNMANWKSVICWGTFSEITDKEERTEAIRRLANRVLPIESSETTHLFPQWPFEPSDLNELKGIVFKINIEKMTGRFEQHDKYSPAIT
jgi:nitroimidazol reductase NimA-like FMN-containing flavoprotein (pyridoxamine 5'-phosphate oxidase superfamily)